MTPFTRLAVLALVACAHAQYAEERAPRYIASEPKQTPAPPVAILKQINSHSSHFGKQVDDPSYLKELQDVMSIVDKETRERLTRAADERTRRMEAQSRRRWLSPKEKFVAKHSKNKKNWHNEDGSYTYGYEAADGSFKIETKSPAGDVKGKYGYKDDTGKVRVIEYGANKYGFQPAGEGITVAPPTLVDETKNEENSRPGKGQANRAQYRPAPQAVDYDYEEPASAPRPAPRPAPQYRAQPAPAQQQYRAPAPPPPPQQQQFRPAPQQQYRPAPAPVPPKPAFFAGAAPVPAEDNFFNPQPQPQQRQFKQQKQDFRPAPQQFQQYAPKPQIEYSQDYSAPAPTKPTSPSNFAQRHLPYSMLDQLLKEYELPSNGAAPLHDITFGSY